jgi:hypothetical protein
VIAIVVWAKPPGHPLFPSSRNTCEDADFNHFMPSAHTGPVAFSALKMHAKAMPGSQMVLSIR